ncbi:MAG: dethiobiotin synthase [Nitrospinota bacterium]|nr:dethiobiotin synthase [Nitrospinota bacterium]
MSYPSFFITGTGTGVGKTVVASAILSYWVSLGLFPRVMKPLESGCSFGLNNPGDAIALGEAASDLRSLDDICPYRYKLPLAPLHASEIEGNPPDYYKLLKMISDLKKYEGPILIEGCGGLLVPLSSEYQVIDLIKDSGLDLLIVSSLGLGCINHTQLTLQIAESKGIKVSGIILNDLDGIPEPAKERNPQAIKELCPVPLIGVFPFIPDLMDVSGFSDKMKENLIKKKKLIDASSSLDLKKLGV